MSSGLLSHRLTIKLNLPLCRPLNIQLPKLQHFRQFLLLAHGKMHFKRCESLLQALDDLQLSDSFLRQTFAAERGTALATFAIPERETEAKSEDGYAVADEEERAEEDEFLVHGCDGVGGEVQAMKGFGAIWESMRW